MHKFLYFSIHFLMMMGCESESKSTDSTTNTTDTNTNEPDSPQSPEPEPEPEPDPNKVKFTGTIAYEDGTEISNDTVRIQMCASSCVRGQLTENGGFEFSSLSAGTYSFDVVPLAGEDNRYASVLDFITLVEGEGERNIDNIITIPTFATSTTVTMDEFEAQDGLIINMDPSSFEPLNESHTEIYAVSVDPNSSGLTFETLSAGTIVKLWHLGPFESHVENWSFRIENLDYPEGTEFQLYSANYANIEWTDLGTAIVNENGTLHSTTELSVLSSLILVQN